MEVAASAAAVLGAMGFLLVRVYRDVWRVPLFVDEAVTALTATRPLGEVVQIVVVDRGGAPGHFVLVHLTFLFHASAGVLRWLSVACALASIAVTFDLGRRIHGRLAGVTAAVVVATSPLLGVYATFGRMYALFVLVSALAADLLVRAAQLRTTGAAVAAGAAVASLPLVHPYGVLPAGLALAAAVLRWRRRPLRLATLGLAAALVAVPVAIASLRLSDRFGVARNSNARLLSPSETVDYVWRTFREYAGIQRPAVLAALLLALAGAFALRSSRRDFVLLAGAAIVVPFVLLAVLPTGRPQGLADVSTRHMIFWLPCYAAFIGAGAAHLLARMPRPAAAVGAAAVAAFFAFFGAPGVGDPREASELNRATAKRGVLQDPSRWLGNETVDGDLLYFASPLYLEALPATRGGWLLDAAPGGILSRTFERVTFPAPGAVIAVPLADSELELGPLASLVDADIYATDEWLVIRLHGPFGGPRAALDRLHEAWIAAMEAVPSPSRRLRGHLRDNEANLCGALRRAGGDCPRDRAVPKRVASRSVVTMRDGRQSGRLRGV